VTGLLNVFVQGGPLMVPLAICSVVAATVIIDRYVALRHAAQGGATLLARLREALARGEGLAVMQQCEEAEGPVAHVLAAGLRAHLLGTSVTQAMEEQTLAEQPALHRRLAVLDTIITLAPLLGLLGTVLGMISSFRIISVSGTSHPTGITGGVAEALLATATGLGIAIFTLIGYNWCRDKLRQITEEIELRATQLENLVAAARPKVRAERREEAPVAH
jgi:biopolymer transport protein ExbB